MHHQCVDELSLFASVIIYTYDRKEYIERAVDSVLNQTIDRRNYEIIVVKGFIEENVERKLGEKVNAILYVPEKGHGEKISAGLEKANGDVIFILDDDDEFEPNRLEVCMSYFEKDPSLVFLHNSINKIDESGKNLSDSVEAAPSDILKMNTDDISRSKLSRFIRFRANWYSSCMAFKKEVLSERNDLIKMVNQSLDPFLFFLALSASGNMLLLPDRLTKYRVHTSTTNYIIPCKEFINRRKTFYDNSSMVFRNALRVLGDRNPIPAISALSSQMEFISMIFTEDLSRGDLIRKFLGYLRSLDMVFTKYQLPWLILAIIKFVSHNAAMKLLYNFYVRSFTNIL